MWEEDAGKDVSMSLRIQNNRNVMTIFLCRLVIIVSLGFGIVKPRLGPLLNR